jgi:hypothetical protein
MRYGKDARQISSLPCARKKTHGKLGFSRSDEQRLKQNLAKKMFYLHGILPKQKKKT